VEFGWAHDAEHVVTERDERTGCGCHDGGCFGLWDIALDDDIFEAAFLGVLCGCVFAFAAADEEECDGVVVLELRRGVKDGVELVADAHVAEVQDDELAGEVVLLDAFPCFVLCIGGEEVGVFPVWDNCCRERFAVALDFGCVPAHEQVNHRGVEADEVVEPAEHGAVEELQRLAR